MGVLDGQAVNAAITNPAFINKNIDDEMPNKLTLSRLASGASIEDIQQAVNTIYLATGVSESDTGTVYNATPSTIDNGDNYQTALATLANKFDPATGHTHSGAAGDAPPIDGSAIGGVPLSEFSVQGTLIAAATGTSTNVSSLLIGQTASSGPTVEGIVVTAPYNRVYLSGSLTDSLVDASGNIVYGRLTHAGSVWTLSYYSLILGVETAYSFSTATSVAWYYKELYAPLVSTPVYDPTYELIARNVRSIRPGSAGTPLFGDLTLIGLNGTSISQSGNTIFISASGSSATGGGGTTSPLTTKGDLWGYNTTNDRIPVGATGTYLTPNPAVPLGVEWAAIPAAAVAGDVARNYVLNSNFMYGQVATSFSTPASSTYIFDQWGIIYTGSGSVFTISQQTFTAGQTDVPGEPQFYMRWNQTTAGTGGGNKQVLQKIESVRTLAGQVCTFSFYAKADTTRSIDINFYQQFGTGGSPSTAVTTSVGTANLTTAWQRFTFTFTLPSISGKTLGSAGDDHLDFRFGLPLNTNMTIDIANVMLNAGSTALNWMLAGLSAGQELRLLQRFYEKSYDVGTAPGAVTETGSFRFMNNATTNNKLGIAYKVTKIFSTHTVTLYNPNSGTSGQIRNIETGTTLTVDTSVSGQTAFYFLTTAAGTAANLYHYQWVANSRYTI